MITDIYFLDGGFAEVEITKINNKSIYAKSTTYGWIYKIDINTGETVRLGNLEVQRKDDGYVRKEDIEYILSQKENLYLELDAINRSLVDDGINIYLNLEHPLVKRRK